MFARVSWRLVAAALFIVMCIGALAGCASSTSQPGAGQPTAQPTAAATAAPQPTAASQPTAITQPTTVPQPTVATQPSAQPARRPTFGFDPRAGMAGAQITINGWDFVPGSDVAIRLGIPQPVGEVLVAARVDAAGRWASSFVLPESLPSGQPVPAGQIALVVMDANTNQSLASAPFSY